MRTKDADRRACRKGTVKKREASRKPTTVGRHRDANATKRARVATKMQRKPPPDSGAINQETRSMVTEHRAWLRDLESSRSIKELAPNPDRAPLLLHLLRIDANAVKRPRLPPPDSGAHAPASAGANPAADGVYLAGMEWALRTVTQMVTPPRVLTCTRTRARTRTRTRSIKESMGRNYQASRF